MSPTPQATISITTSQSVQAVNDLIAAVNQLTKAMKELQRAARATGKTLSDTWTVASKFSAPSPGAVGGSAKGTPGTTIFNMYGSGGSGGGGGGSGGGRSGFRSNDPLYRVMDAIAWILPAKGEQLYGSMRGLQTIGMPPFAAAGVAGIVTGGLAAMEMQKILDQQIAGAQTLSATTGVQGNIPPPGQLAQGLSDTQTQTALGIAARQHVTAAELGISTSTQTQIAQMLASAGQFGPQNATGNNVNLVDEALVTFGMDTQTATQMVRDSFGNLQMTSGQLQQTFATLAQQALVSGVSAGRISNTLFTTNLANLFGPNGTALSAAVNSAVGDQTTANFLVTAATSQAGLNNPAIEAPRTILYNAGTGQHLSMQDIEKMEQTPAGMAKLMEGMAQALNPAKMPYPVSSALFNQIGAKIPTMPDGSPDVAAIRRLYNIGTGIEDYGKTSPMVVAPSAMGAYGQGLALAASAQNPADVIRASAPPNPIDQSKQAMLAVIDSLGHGDLLGAMNTAFEFSIGRMAATGNPQMSALYNSMYPNMTQNIPGSETPMYIQPTQLSNQSGNVNSPYGTIPISGTVNVNIDVSNGGKITSTSIPVAVTSGNTANGSYQGLSNFGRGNTTVLANNQPAKR